MAQPFMPALSWAVALAIVAHPVHGWLKRKVKKPGLAATLAVVVVAILIVAPAAFLLQALVGKVGEVLRMIQSGELQKSIEQAAQSQPQMKQAWAWMQESGGSKVLFEQFGNAGNSFVKPMLGGSIWGIATFLIALLLLFYFWRDRPVFTGYIRHFSPMSDLETDRVFKRFRETVQASIYGTLVVATVQGILGGLMFWWLGLPAPLLWGFVMGLLSIIPVLGAFVIWIPAAIFLATQGQWGKAVILTVWGTVVVGMIDNLLYPVLVGKKLRMHTVPVFIGIVGGLALFGASGLVLGPVILAMTDAVLNIWRTRTRSGGTADTPVEAPHA